MHAYRTSYNIIQTLTQDNACISDKLRCPSHTSTDQCMSYRTRYDALQTLTHNNACNIGQATMSFRNQHRTMHVISDKLPCPSNTNTEQCMSYRKRYDVLQTLTQNNACYIGKLRSPSFTNTEQSMSYRTSYDILQTLTQNNAFHIGKATMYFRF